MVEKEKVPEKEAIKQTD